MARVPAIHSLKHNASERSPSRLFVFDTETLPEPLAAGELHTLHLWCARLVERHSRAPKKPHPTWWQGHTVAELADALEAAHRVTSSLWVVAHNLGFDLAVTRLPLELVARGWEIGDHALPATSPWLRMKRAGKTVTMVDSHSWLARPLEHIAAALGREKLPLPAWEATEADWFARCANDVDVLAEAMTTVLDWWDAQKLGHWSLTGPATGWNAYRHRLGKASICIDPDPAGRALERSAIYGGRREVWRVGQQPMGTYAVIDFTHAFGSVCATQVLPRRRGVAFDGLPIDHRVLHSRISGIIARVEVETAAPRYPLRTKHGIFHPTGRFETVLCQPEILEASRRGELRAIGPGYFVLVAPHMQPWADWCLRLVDGDESDTPEVAAIMAKEWTRTVPGKWAGRTGRVIAEFDQPIEGWRAERGRHHPNGVPCVVLDIGGKRQWIAQDQDQDNAFPAVLAWVQSYVRVAMGRLIDAAGAGAVLQCNTDGLLVDLMEPNGLLPGGLRLPVDVDRLHDQVQARLDELAGPDPAIRAVVKRICHDVEILSPQHLVIDHNRHLSGIPRSAELLGEHLYRFTDWPRLLTQMSEGDSRGYVRRDHLVDLTRMTVTGWTTTDGRVIPPHAAMSARDGHSFSTWRWTPHRPADAVLVPLQHPALAPLADVAHGRP